MRRGSSAWTSVATGNPRGTGRAVGESERFVVPTKPAKVGPPGRESQGIADATPVGKEPQFKANVLEWRGPGDWR